MTFLFLTDTFGHAGPSEPQGQDPPLAIFADIINPISNQRGGRLCPPHYYLSPWIFRTSYKPGTWTFFQLSLPRDFGRYVNPISNQRGGGGRLSPQHYYLSPWIFRTSYKPGTWTFFQLSREMKWRHTFQQMDFCNSEFLMGNKWRRSESKLSPPLSISLFLFSFVTSRKKKLGNCRWHRN